MPDPLTSPSRNGPWAPLRLPLFRALWLASVVSNVGTVMHTVAAGWAMTSLTSSPVVVSLAQAAWSVPGFLLAVPAGALADIVDRRRFIAVMQVLGMAVALALGVIDVTGHLTVGILLAGTFLLSVALTLPAPAFLALIPELVESDQLPQAIGLNAVAYNGPQSVAPALAGVAIAAAGPGAVFLLNAASFLGIVVVARWYRPSAPHSNSDEKLTAAMRTGVRYFRAHRGLQRYALRVALAFFVTSSLASLLPVLARRRLDVHAGQFGLVATSVGLGVIVALWAMPRLQPVMSPDALVLAAGVAWGVSALTLGLTHSLVVALPALLLGGAAQMVTMNTVYARFMGALPSWVRGRASSVLMLVVWLGTSIGAVTWGAVASSLGVGRAMAIAAGAQLVVSLACFVVLRLDRTTDGPQDSPTDAPTGETPADGPGDTVPA